MNPIQTGIAVALALAVVAMFFIFPKLSPFGSSGQNAGSSASQNPAALAQPSASGQVQATDEVVGTGAAAEAGDTVTVNYVGSLTDGTVFDASANHGSAGFSFKLGAGQVIQGWDEGIAGMKEGGKRKLIIPPALAYGAQSPAPSIPPNSTLVFEVELVKVQKAQ